MNVIKVRGLSMNIIVINGPNLNMLGKRETSVYGNDTLMDLENYIKKEFNDINIEFFQSNYEGAIIEMLHKANEGYDGVVLNPGAFTHYSYAIHDAIKSIKTKVVEVHISNITQREEFRRVSLLTDICTYAIIGHGTDGYMQAIEWILSRNKK